MKRTYTKPNAWVVEFSIEDRIMDVNDYSEGVGSGDPEGDYGDE